MLAFFALIVLCGVLSTKVFALVGGQGGLWGYSQFPSASQLKPGNVTIYGGAQDSNLSSQNFGLIYSPVALMELGATAHKWDPGRTGVLSLKIQIPRMDPWQPILSMGVIDLGMDQRRWENLYFVGGYRLESGDMTLFVDLGAIYQRRPFGNGNQVTAYFASEFDFGVASLMLESSRSAQGIGLTPSLWIRGFSDLLYLGGGMNWLSSQAQDYRDLWGQAGLQIPLGAVEGDSPNPWLYLDLNPGSDHFFQARQAQFQSYLDVQGAVRTSIPGLFWINGATFFTAHSKNRNRLSKHNIWDRSYILFDRRQEWGGPFLVRAPQVSAGMLLENSIGITLRQEMRHRSWNPVQLDLGVHRGNHSGQEANLRLPLHPIGPSILKWIQLYGEGGEYLWEGKQIFGGLRIGGTSNYLDGALGYGTEGKQVLARIDLRMNLSRWTTSQAGPVQIRAFNRLEHHLHLNLNDLDAEEFEPSIQGNPQNRLSQFPWSPPQISERKKKRVILPSLLDKDNDALVDSLDACPNLPEDKDAFQDLDGCPDVDNDTDRIPDSLDKCPLEAEDEDLYMDEDGCPDFDNDLDAIPDSLDACANTPEDRDSYLDLDGCPDPDNDHDGIRDGEDACPDQAGTFIRGNPRNGCPEGDDNDGIPFELDACPNASEDYDGFQDSDGCPDP